MTGGRRPIELGTQEADVILIGVVLLAAGLVTWGSGVGSGDTAAWWLLPPGLLAAGCGVLVAAVLVWLRRGWAPLRLMNARRPGPARGGPIRRARAVPSMIAGAWRGESGAVPRYQTLLWLVALIYVVSPVDFLPEFLPLIGVTDDIGVGAWLLSTVYAEAGGYLARRGAASDDRSG